MTPTEDTFDKNGAMLAEGFISFEADKQIGEEKVAWLLQKSIADQIGYKIVQNFEPFTTNSHLGTHGNLRVIVLSEKDYARLCER